MNTLSIAVSFAHGVYNGREWPPSPGRLFQALVAGNTIGCRKLAWGDPEESAMRWLESLDPPEIVVPRYAEGAKRIQYVPNNDSEGGNATKLHYPRWVHGPVRYVWRIPEGDEELARVIARMSQRILCLGLGEDSAWARGDCLDGARPLQKQETRCMPGGRGSARLMTPSSGFLDAVKESWRSRSLWPRPRRPRGPLIRYGGGKGPGREMRVFRLESADEPGSVVAFPWASACVVAAWVRHAAGVRLENAEPEFLKRVVMGHCAPGEIGERWAYVPLPSIHPQFGDGLIRRVAIMAPQASRASDISRLDGALLTDQDGKPTARLALESQTPPMYSGEASVVRSVTPVVFPGHWLREGKPRLKRLRAMLNVMLAEAGCDPEMLRTFDVRREPFFRGCERAGEAKTPGHLRSLPLAHVELTFAQTVDAPLLLGPGRFCGLGCLARC